MKEIKTMGETMGKYKGTISARCLHCDCKSAFNMEEKPFLYCEIVGTCDHCMNRRTHNCYDEFQGRKIGRKIFLKPKKEVKKCKTNRKQKK